jgi:O-antigen/teichoic acid export membrane protein
LDVGRRCSGASLGDKAVRSFIVDAGNDAGIHRTGLAMQLLASIRKDVLSKFVGEVISRLVFLLFFFWVGRKLQAADFGSLNLAISATYMLGVLFLDPGLNLSTIQMLVERPQDAKRIAGSVFLAKLLLFFPLLIVLWGMSRGLGSRLPCFFILFLAALYALFTVVLEYLSSVTNAFHRMDLEAFLKIFNRVLIVIFGVLALRLGHISALLFSMLVATLFACVLAWGVLAGRLIRVIPQWHLDAVWESFRRGLPIAGTSIATTIYLNWDLLVLSYFNVNREQIGWYAAGFKIVVAFSAFPTVLGSALFPMMVQLQKRDPEMLDRLLGLSTKAMLLFALPVAATVSVLSGKIVLLVYGAKYLSGGNVLAILIWSIVPIFVYFYLVFVNIAAGHARYNLLAGFVALIAGLGCNAILVPRIGYLGAAWSALAANATFALLATWNVCRLFPNASLPAVLLRLITAGCAMMTVIFFAPASPPVQLLLGLVAYFIVLVALGTLGAGDLSLAIRLMGSRTLPQGQQP